VVGHQSGYRWHLHRLSCLVHPQHTPRLLITKGALDTTATSRRGHTVMWVRSECVVEEKATVAW